MKKIIFLFTLVLAVTMISGYKQSAQKEMAEKYSKPATFKDFKGINKPDVSEYKPAVVSSISKKAPGGRSGILFMLSNDKKIPVWSPSFWWANAGQSGC